MTHGFICSLVLLTSLILSSCGLVQKVGLRSTTGLIRQAAVEMETETNWPLFKDALPANLKTMEGLLFLDPTNADLLLSLLKAQNGLAFGVEETLLLEDTLSKREASFHRDQAKAFYERAIHYGQRYLLEKQVEYPKMMEEARESEAKLQEYLSAKLGGSGDDVEAVFFFAQALGSLINLDRGNFSLMSQLPLVKSLFDWACSKDEKINFGACHIFYGSYEVGRPQALGGNLEKGKKHFTQAIAQYPDNLLIRVSYLQFYAIPKMDENEFKAQKEFLLKAFADWDQANKWDIDVTPLVLKPEAARINLMNAIAKTRFQTMLKYEKDLF